MTPEFKAKWIEALRSDKYKQARGVLKDEDGCMCCLGVAVELIDPSKWNPAITGSDDERGFGWAGDSATSCAAVSRAIGIDLIAAKNLAIRNDGNAGHSPHSFAQIADYIEQKL